VTSNSDSERIDALLPFLPVMEARIAGEWRGGDKNPDGSITMPWMEYDQQVLDFTRACGAGGWLEPFDWMAWLPEALYIHGHPELLESASLETLQKLLTLHIRRDRFFEGHLANMIEDGHIAAILRRMAAIRVELP
jgi:hypothetical protein